MNLSFIRRAYLAISSFNFNQEIDSIQGGPISASWLMDKRILMNLFSAKSNSCL